jgi:putative salt-induced outer membrane protein YdiY
LFLPFRLASIHFAALKTKIIVICMKSTPKTLLATILLIVTGWAVPAGAQTAAAPATNWQNTATLGLTIARGNTDTTLVSVAVDSAKKWTNSDLHLGADAIYGDTRLPNAPASTETADAEHGFAQYNQNFTDRFFGYGRLEGMHDGIADIQYRVTATPGAGYYFIKNKTADLSLEGGPGFITEKLGDQTSSYATLRIAEKSHYRISEHAKAWESIEYLPQVDEFDNYIVDAEVGIEAGLNKSNKLALRTVLDDSYDNVPAAGRLKNDLKLIAGITYKF